MARKSRKKKSTKRRPPIHRQASDFVSISDANEEEATKVQASTKKETGSFEPIEVAKDADAYGFYTEFEDIGTKADAQDAPKDAFSSLAIKKAAPEKISLSMFEVLAGIVAGLFGAAFVAWVGNILFLAPTLCVVVAIAFSLFVMLIIWVSGIQEQQMNKNLFQWAQEHEPIVRPKLKK